MLKFATKQQDGSYSGSFVKQAYGDISSLSTLSVTPNDADNETDGIQLQITSTNGVNNKEAMCTVTDTKTTYNWEELAGSTNLAEQNYNGKATTVRLPPLSKSCSMSFLLHTRSSLVNVRAPCMASYILVYLFAFR